MSRVSPTQRVLAHCKKMGWKARVAEKWIPVPSHPAKGVRKDLFGCIDVVVLDGLGGGPLGVQACAGSTHAAHRAKAIAEPLLVDWLLSPARFEIWSFEKKGPRGKRKLWELRRDQITTWDDQLMIAHAERVAGSPCTGHTVPVEEPDPF